MTLRISRRGFRVVCKGRDLCSELSRVSGFFGEELLGGRRG